MPAWEIRDTNLVIGDRNRDKSPEKGIDTFAVVELYSLEIVSDPRRKDPEESSALQVFDCR